MSEFPLKEFVDAVVRIVGANPDKVYLIPPKFDNERDDWVEGDTCLYVARDPDTNELEGSCLLGCALLEAEALTAESLEGIGDWFGGVSRKNKWDLPRHVLDWAGTIQSQQDSGSSWGAALDHADNLWGRPVV